MNQGNTLQTGKTIAVNARFLIEGKMEGIGRFTFESLKLITEKHPEHRFIFIFDRPYSETFIFSDNVIPVVMQPPARHPFLWYAWFEWALPRVFKKYKPDAFLSTDGFLSLNSNVPSSLVIHDLAFLHYPEMIDGLSNRFYKHFTPKYVAKAKRIATVSEYSKSDIVSKYGIAPDKIDVVYNGANISCKPLMNGSLQAVKDQYTDGKDYFLFVGAVHPRKNLGRLLKAFDKFKSKHNSDVKLLVVGRKAWHVDRAMGIYESMKYKEDVIFKGHLSIQEVSKVTAGALALTYVSVFEGFGIPILEALYCESPVITSNISSMPEVAGDAALLIDPHSVDSIEEAMSEIYLKPELRKKLIHQGRIQRENFKWELTADKLWKNLEQVLEISESTRAY